MIDQLAFDGMKVTGQTPSPVTARLNDTQRAVLRIVAEKGEVRPVEAGLIAHATRSGRFGCRKEKSGGEACCVFASTDGLEVIKRLVKRGLLVKSSRGIYVAPRGEEV